MVPEKRFLKYCPTYTQLKTVSLVVAPHDPPEAMNLTNLHCTMSESFHVYFSHSGPVVLEKKIRKTFFLYMHL
jgi:hypothetical protein